MIIFDFDGTIADSFGYVYGFLAAEAGKPLPIDASEMERYRGLTMKDMALKLGIPVWRLPYLYFKGRRVMRGHILRLQPFDGMPELIRDLSGQGYTLAIVSSNSTRNVRKFLRNQDLQHCFVAAKGGAGILGKIRLFKQLRQRYKAEQYWCIGDEVADIASAKAAGMHSIAVTWGFADDAGLERAEPTAIATTVAEINSILADSRYN